MEENNELMTTEDEEIVESDDSGSGFGLGILIGTALWGAGYAGYKGIKKLWAKHKAKKEHIDEDDEFYEMSEKDVKFSDVEK